MKAFQIDVEDNDLANAEYSAWELAVALREIENIDAYVWHDRYHSYVTVGSFESPNDPKLKRYMQVFAPRRSPRSLHPAIRWCFRRHRAEISASPLAERIKSSVSLQVSARSGMRAACGPSTPN